MPTARTTHVDMLSVCTLLMTLTISPALLSAQPHFEAMQTAVQSMALATGGTAEVAHSSVTGLASFVNTTDDQPLSVKSAATAPAEERALAFVHAYGPAFGLLDVSQVQVTQAQGMDEVGMEHVRLQQLHQGVPVTAGELTVHLRGATVVSVLAKTLADLDTLDTTPSLTPDDAIEAA